MIKNLILAFMLVAFAPASFATEPMPPEFPREDEQLPEDGPEPDYSGQESYETDPEEGEGGMIGEIFRTSNLPVGSTSKKEDRGEVVVYTITTQQVRGFEVCTTTTVTMVHKATEKILSSNTDSACFNYNY